METYIENACALLNIKEGGRIPKTPISVQINTETAPLEKWKIKEFLTALGMLGWLAQTVRCACCVLCIFAHCTTQLSSHSISLGGIDEDL